jgi:hypothetical protein
VGVTCTVGCSANTDCAPGYSCKSGACQ